MAVATKTINELGRTPGVTSLFQVPVRNPATGLTRYVDVATLLRGAQPATSTFSTLGSEQDHTALKTFLAGISLGNDTLSHYSQDPWTPVFADASSGGNAASGGTFEGFYVRIGSLVVATWRAINIATGSMTGTNTLFIRGLPFVSLNSTNYRAYSTNYFIQNVTFTGIPVLALNTNVSFMSVSLMASGATAGTMLVSALTSGTAVFGGTIVYRTN